MSFSTTLYVGNLSLYCTPDELENLFSSFGQIKSVHLKKGTNGGVSYAFLKYCAPGSAEKALQKMNGVMLHGRKLRVGWADEYENGKLVSAVPAVARANDLQPTAQVHVSFHSSSWAPITEALLRSIFGRFGVVQDVSIKKVQMTKEIGAQTGYGFVHYSLDKEGVLASMLAVEAMNGVVVDGVRFTCSVSKSLSTLVQETADSRARGVTAWIPLHQSQPTSNTRSLVNYSRAAPCGFDSAVSMQPLYSNENTASFNRKRPLYPSSQSYSHPFQSRQMDQPSELLQLFGDNEDLMLGFFL